VDTTEIISGQVDKKGAEGDNRDIYWAGGYNKVNSLGKMKQEDNFRAGNYNKDNIWGDG